MFGLRLGNPIETIELAGGERRWKAYILHPGGSTEPFDVSAKITFNWSAINVARAGTCEEDLLTEVLGRKQTSAKTAQRFTRVDLKLQANLPYGSTTTIPDPKIFGSWTESVGQKLDRLLNEFRERQGRVIAVLGARQEMEIEARCDAEGQLSLKGLSVSGFLLVRVPRVWDDPDRRDAEKGATTELSRLAQRFKDALDEWAGSIGELNRWIRYAPPSPDSKRLEPQFEEEDEDGGPETIH